MTTTKNVDSLFCNDCGKPVGKFGYIESGSRVYCIRCFTSSEPKRSEGEHRRTRTSMERIEDLEARVKTLEERIIKRLVDGQ
jgi:hypothetical protein